MTGGPSFRLALCQLLAASDKEANWRRAEALVGEAVAAGARLVALPELFFWRGPSRKEVGAAEGLDGVTARRLAELARRHEIVLLGGSILERIEGEERVYNSSLLFGPRGDLLACYRKIHLFDVKVKGARSLQESRHRKAGSELVVAGTPLLRVGLSICYDLRFPVLFRRLALAGAELICLPAAFLEKTGRAHWKSLIRARAIENGCFFAAVNQCGVGPDGMACYGHSMVVDPWGDVLVEAGSEEGVVLAELSLGRLREVREQIPTLEHCRLGLDEPSGLRPESDPDSPAPSAGPNRSA